MTAAPVATTADALRLILEEENSALARRDFVAAGAVLAAKQIAAEALADSLRAQSPHTKVPHAEQNALRALAQTAVTNRTLIATALRVQKRVIALVMEAARAGQTTPYYGAVRAPRRAARALSRRL